MLRPSRGALGNTRLNKAGLRYVWKPSADRSRGTRLLHRGGV